MPGCPIAPDGGPAGCPIGANPATGGTRCAPAAGWPAGAVSPASWPARWTGSAVTGSGADAGGCEPGWDIPPGGMPAGGRPAGEPGPACPGPAGCSDGSTCGPGTGPPIGPECWGGGSGPGCPLGIGWADRWYSAMTGAV